MTLPREVISGRFYMITRRCTQRQFLLRPDEETNNAFLYCLAEAAQRCNIAVLLTCALSNHHHTVIFDRDGTVPAFTEHFHKLLAKCQNAWRGRWENLWASEQACVVHLVEPADVMHKLVYVATNPVKDRLVEKVHHWPGVNGLAALLGGRTLHATRPRHFFCPGGSMPPAVTLTLALPPGAATSGASATTPAVAARVRLWRRCIPTAAALHPELRERDRGGPGERRGDQRRERDHLPWRRALSMRSLQAKLHSSPLPATKGLEEKHDYAHSADCHFRVRLRHPGVRVGRVRHGL